MTCPLCTIPQRRHEENIYYEDDEIVVADAKNKKGHKERIMLILKKHQPSVSREQEKIFIRKFIEAIKPRFGGFKEFYVFGNFPVDPRVDGPTITDHWHKIACDKDEKAVDFKVLFRMPRNDLIRISLNGSHASMERIVVA